MDAQNLNLTVTAFTTVVISILAWVLPFYVYLKIYATLIKQALKLILIERILLQYASKKLATYFSGILDTRKSYSTECILSFRVVTALLQHDTEGIFYKQLLRDSIIPRTLSILDELSSSQSANIDVEKKEQLVGGAALAMMWVLLRCGQITIDEDTNDLICPSNITQQQGLGAILQQLLRRRSSNRDLCDDIVQYLTQISLEMDFKHLMTSANKICSLIRVLLEVDRCVQDNNRDLHDRFFSPEFIDVVLNLVMKDIHILEDSNNRNENPKVRSRYVRRLRNLLRLLSLSPFDGERRAEIEARLVSLFRDSNHRPRLDVKDFDALSQELRSVTSLPATKIFVDRHAISIPEQLQRAEEESYKMQNVLAELERNLTQSRLAVEERDRELEVLRPKLQQKEVETRAQQSTMAELEEHLTRSRALAAERDLSLRTMLSRLQLEQEEVRELENSLVEREIVVTDLRAIVAEKGRALETVQSQLLLQQEETKGLLVLLNLIESHRAQSELERENTIAAEIALQSSQEEAERLKTSLADKDLLLGEMQKNLTQSLVAAAEWDKERPKVATMTWELRQSQLRNEQFERQVISLQAFLEQLKSKLKEKEDEANTTQGELLRLRVALQAQTVMKAPLQSIISSRPPRTQPTLPGSVLRRWSNSDASCLRVLEGHVRDVMSVCVSPDGSLIASGSFDGDIRVWSMVDGSCVKHLLDRTFVLCVCFSPDGNSLASASKTNYQEGAIKIWSLSTGMCITTLTVGFCNTYFNWLCYSPDGRSLASGTNKQTVQVWSIASESCLQIFEGHGHEISAVCFSPDGSMIASGSCDFTIRLWSLSTGSCSMILREEHTGKVLSVCFSPDGSILASSSEDRSIRLWTLSTGSVATLLGHDDWIPSISFSSDGASLASASWDSTIRIWSVASGSCSSILRGHLCKVHSVCFSPNGSSLISGGGGKVNEKSDYTVRVWSTSTELHIQALSGHTSSVYSTCFSPDCSYLATRSLDSTIRIWSLDTGVCERTLTGGGYKVYSICFSPDGASIAAGSADGTIRIWSLSAGSDAGRILTGHMNGVQSVCYSSQGGTIASGSFDCTIRIWSASTGVCEQTLTGHTDAVSCVCYCSDEIRLASGSADRTIRIWSLPTGFCVNILIGHSNQVTSICFSPDGGELVSASADHTVRLWKLWSLTAGSCVKTCEEHTDSVNSVCFSPDGSCFASGSLDNSIRIWSTSIALKESIRLLTHHVSPVRSVCFSSDGYQLASGSDDHSIFVFGEKAISP